MRTTQEPSNKQGLTMTLSLGQIGQYFHSLMGRRALSRNNFPRLDANALSARDLRDLKLPPELSSRLTRLQEVHKNHRGI